MDSGDEDEDEGSEVTPQIPRKVTWENAEQDTEDEKSVENHTPVPVNEHERKKRALLMKRNRGNFYSLSAFPVKSLDTSSCHSPTESFRNTKRDHPWSKSVPQLSTTGSLRKIEFLLFQ